MMSSNAQKLLDFYQSLKIEVRLPRGIQIMNPFLDPYIIELNKKFLTSYFNDSAGRILILGINPGRFGAGVTGIPFTDPLKLENNLGIQNNLEKRRELSSDFIYDVIEAYGGSNRFYNQFLLSAICPLGLTQEGKNINYYDIPDLQRALNPFIINSLKKQIALVGNKSKAICIGQGKNYDYLIKLNQEYNLFRSITTLPHPRWIMQYRSKCRDDYITMYLKELKRLS